MEFIILYMEQIIDIAIRALLTVNTTPDDTKCMIEMTKVHATNLLQLLEASVGSSVFIGHYSLKRRKLAADAIMEPKVYAERKVIDFTYCIHDVEKSISHHCHESVYNMDPIV